jgi:hypothetical protein
MLEGELVRDTLEEEREGGHRAEDQCAQQHHQCEADLPAGGAVHVSAVR